MCYKMLYEIIVSTTVKPKEIKTVQTNQKDLTKKKDTSNSMFIFS